jgi:hypothetical protein
VGLFRRCSTVARSAAWIRSSISVAEYSVVTRPALCPSWRWLDHEIAGAQKPLLVVTHHAPTLRTVYPRLALQLSNGAFHNDFDSLIRPPVLAWIHGHTHFSCEVLVNGIRVVSNQRGYPGEGCVFDWDFVLDL